MLPNSLRPKSLAPWAESLKVKLYTDTVSASLELSESHDSGSYRGCVDGHRSRLGGGIGRGAAGINVSLDCLLMAKADLPRVELERLKVGAKIGGHGRCGMMGV